MKKCILVFSLLTAAGLSFAGAIWLPAPASPSPASMASSQDHTTGPEVQIRDVQLIAQTGSSVTWRLIAEHASFSRAMRLALVQGIDATISGATADTWRITAMRGRVDRTTGDMVVEGRVRLQQSGGDTIDTDELRWDPTRRLLHTDTPVTLRSAYGTLTARGFHSQVDGHRITLEREVHGVFRLRRPR